MKTELPILAVIVPCFNPQEGWADVLAERFRGLREALAEYAIVHLTLINDGSGKGVLPTHISALETSVGPFKYVTYAQNRGKGAALRAGVAATEADFYLMTDIDFPYTQKSMEQVAKVLLTEGGIVSGHREETYYETVPWFRKLLSKALRLMLKYFMRLPVTDSQCGLKAMDNQGRQIFLQTTIDRYLFDLEFLQKANGKVSVRPVSVELRPGVVFTQMGLKVLKAEFGNFLKLLF